MVDSSEWKIVNEGNLARTWERRLKPRIKARPRRRWAPWAVGTAWIVSMWLVAVLATMLAVHVVIMGYQVDALQSQLTSASRSNQNLKMQVASLSSASHLSQEAVRLKVQFMVPSVHAATTAIHQSSRPKVKTPSSAIGDITRWIQTVRGAVTR